MLLERWGQQVVIPVSKLSHRLLTHLRKTSDSDDDSVWDELCVAHKASPQFVFELENDTVRLRLKAVSETDQSTWQWNGHEWQKETADGEHWVAYHISRLVEFQLSTISQAKRR